MKEKIKANFYVMLEWFDEDLDTEFMPVNFIPTDDYNTALFIAQKITSDMLAYINFGEPTHVYVIEEPCEVWSMKNFYGNSDSSTWDTQDFLYKLQQPANNNTIHQDTLVLNSYEPSDSLIYATEEYQDYMNKRKTLDFC